MNGIECLPVGQGKWLIRLDGHAVGHIRKGDDHQFRYFPKGSKTSGEPFRTLAACRQSLEPEQQE